jgi:hypothetical protein
VKDERMSRHTDEMKDESQSLNKFDQEQSTSKPRTNNFKTKNEQLQNQEPTTSKPRTNNFKTKNQQLLNQEPSTS